MVKREIRGLGEIGSRRAGYLFTADLSNLRIRSDQDQRVHLRSERTAKHRMNHLRRTHTLCILYVKRKSMTCLQKESSIVGQASSGDT